VAKNIVSRSNISWNGDSPGVVVGNELIRGPCTGGGRIIDQSHSINLEELQFGLVNSLAVSITAGEVV
jgi:hypothetical protein